MWPSAQAKFYNVALAMNYSVTMALTPKRLDTPGLEHTALHEVIAVLLIHNYDFSDKQILYSSPFIQPFSSIIRCRLSSLKANVHKALAAAA